MANIPVTYALKTAENLWFYGVLRGCIMVTLTRSVLKYKRGFFVRLVSALVPKIRNIANDLLQEVFIVKLTVEGIFDQRVLLILKFEKYN